MLYFYYLLQLKRQLILYRNKLILIILKQIIAIEAKIYIAIISQAKASEKNNKR